MAREEERERSLPLRAGAPLKKALAVRGFVARLVVARKDGEPLTADDKREVDATVHAYEGVDKAAHKALKEGDSIISKKPGTREPAKRRAQTHPK